MATKDDRSNYLTGDANFNDWKPVASESTTFRRGGGTISPTEFDDDGFLRERGERPITPDTTSPADPHAFATTVQTPLFQESLKGGVTISFDPSTTFFGYYMRNHRYNLCGFPSLPDSSNYVVARTTGVGEAERRTANHKKTKSHAPVRVLVTVPKNHSTHYTHFVLVGSLRRLRDVITAGTQTMSESLGKRFTKNEAAVEMIGQGMNVKNVYFSELPINEKAVSLDDDASNHHLNYHGEFDITTWGLEGHMGNLQVQKKIEMMNAPVQEFDVKNHLNKHMAVLQIMVLATSASSKFNGTFPDKHKYIAVSTVCSPAFVIGSTRTLTKQSRGSTTQGTQANKVKKNNIFSGVGDEKEATASQARQKITKKGTSSLMTQNKLPLGMIQMTETGACGHMYSSLKLLVSYIQLRSGYVKNPNPNPNLKNKKNCTFIMCDDEEKFSKQNFLLARKRLAHCGMFSHEFIQWSSGTMVPQNFYNELGGSHRVAEYVREFFGRELLEYDFKNTDFYQCSSITWE